MAGSLAVTDALFSAKIFSCLGMIPMLGGSGGVWSLLAPKVSGLSEDFDFLRGKGRRGLAGSLAASEALFSAKIFFLQGRFPMLGGSGGASPLHGRGVLCLSEDFDFLRGKAGRRLLQ